MHIFNHFWKICHIFIITYYEYTQKKEGCFYVAKITKVANSFWCWKFVCGKKKPKGFMVAKNSDPMLKILYHIMSKSITIDVSQNYEWLCV